jgi:hypothetical protein
MAIFGDWTMLDVSYCVEDALDNSEWVLIEMEEAYAKG